jgi:hypothetical protein
MWIGKPNCLHLHNSRLAADTKPEDLTACAASFDPVRLPRGVVVHFDGGQFTLATGPRVTARLEAAYQQAGTLPFFILDEAHSLQPVVENLNRVRETPVARQLTKRLVQFARRKGPVEEGDRSGPSSFPALAGLSNRVEAWLAGVAQPTEEEDTLELPATEPVPAADEQQQQFLEELGRDRILQDACFYLETEQSTADDAFLTKEIRAEIDQAKETQPAQDRSLVGAAALVVLKQRASLALYRIVERGVKKRHHGVYATVVEELLRAFFLTLPAKVAWDQIKVNARNASRPDWEGGNGGVFRLLEALRATRPVQVTAVGEGSGALYACHFLEQALEIWKGESVRFNLILLAPTCDFLLLEHTTQQLGKRLAGLRIFGLKDEHERQDRFGLLYPRSLPYFISGVLEMQPDWPLVGMQRFYSDRCPFPSDQLPDQIYQALRRCREKLEQSYSLVWSPSRDFEGREAEATMHTSFAGDQKTHDSIQHLLTAGF